MKLLTGDQKLERLKRLQYLEQFLESGEAEVVGLLHDPVHDPVVVLQRLVGVPVGLPDLALLGLVGNDRNGVVGELLLGAGHLPAQLLLLPNGPQVEGVDAGHLGRGEVLEALGLGLEEVVEAGLEVGAGDGVEEADEDGGPAAGEPEEGILQGGAPGGGEEGGGVDAGEAAASGDVVVEVGDAVAEERLDLVVVVGFVERLKGVEEVGQVLALDLHPLLEAAAGTLLVIRDRLIIIIILYLPPAPAAAAAAAIHGHRRYLFVNLPP